MAKTLDFYFDLMSPFAYLASTQLDALGRRANATVRWNPVYLPGIFRATGNHGPLTILAKGIHTVKDLNDWAGFYGLRPIALPSRFPAASALANRVALALEPPQVGPFVQHLGARIWHDDADCSVPEVVTTSLSAVGVVNLADVMARAQTQELKELLRTKTDEVVARGAFGVPTFFVGDEMFVGNDRLQFVERALR
jgi:2-hydroxychromene-2-carboxylate isomerase